MKNFYHSKSLKAVTNLSGESLKAMFDLCQAFGINVYHHDILIFDISMDELLSNKVQPKYYEEGIRNAFHEYVVMYNYMIKG